MENNFTVTIATASRELTKREAVKYKDTTDCIRISESDSLTIKPVLWLELNIHNDNAKKDKDYKQYIIVDADGTTYLTGSDNFYRNFLNIANEMEGEEFEIKTVKKPSKNYGGKDFLTCVLV